MEELRRKWQETLREEYELEVSRVRAKLEAAEGQKNLLKKKGAELDELL